MTSDSEPAGPHERDLERRLDEQREHGEVHRPAQVEATADPQTSVDEERRALGQQPDGA